MNICVPLCAIANDTKNEAVSINKKISGVIFWDYKDTSPKQQFQCYVIEDYLHQFSFNSTHVIFIVQIKMSPIP